MTAAAPTASVPSLDHQVVDGLHVAFEGITKALVAKVNTLIAQQLGRQAASKTIEQKVAAMMPVVLEQAFILDFLQDNQDSARLRRAILSHLLSAAELQNVGGSVLIAPLAGMPSEAAPTDAEELTSEAASKLLHVSRTHLNTLVDTGQLGEVRRTAGGHRRISKAAVLQYKAASKDRQAKGLDAMVEATERLGLYDSELDGIPVRSKR